MYRTSARPLREAAKRYPIRARWRLLRLRWNTRRFCGLPGYRYGGKSSRPYSVWVLWPRVWDLDYPYSGRLSRPVRPPPRMPAPKADVL